MNFGLEKFAGKHVVFIGRARDGLSFERFIMSHGNILSFRFVDLLDDPNYLDSLKMLDINTTVVVKTAGMPGRLVGVPYTTSTNVFFECARTIGCKIIGVTGTKGKTTTSSIIAAILKAHGQNVQLCGNIGRPMLDALEVANEQTVFVVELSSYMLEDMEISPDIAVITNLYHDHLDYHGSDAKYHEAKSHIVKYQSADSFVVYDSRFEVVASWLKNTQAHLIDIKELPLVDIKSAKLMGKQNQLNATMAREVAKIMGVSDDVIEAAILEFVPVRHRLQIVAIKNKIIYIDDAIGSNPEATIAGINTVVSEVGPIGCLFLGGSDRDYDYRELIDLIVTQNIPCLVLFPDTGQKIANQLPLEYQPLILHSTDMTEAVSWAASRCKAGSVCLLSCAAPSYSLWKDFEEKGDQFQAAVKSLSDL